MNNHSHQSLNQKGAKQGRYTDLPVKVATTDDTYIIDNPAGEKLK